ncbi:hypothetical protein DL769_003621 [Monosporascus sp. CRB-8-3]|nr:hypothetical protein DL769_003621 [Monosporascus sp. CRB-8-3]
MASSPFSVATIVASYCTWLAEVFDGEAEGARRGLREAYRINARAQIHVCIDNTSVITGLIGGAPLSSQEAFLEFQEIAKIAGVNIKCAPGHEGIAGNEEADRLAKEGSKLPVGDLSSATYAGAKRRIKGTKNRLSTESWEQLLPNHKRYQDLRLKSATLECPKELVLPLTTLHHLLASRSGHGDFENYRRRMGHTDMTPCSCGRIKTPEHIVFYQKTRRLRAQWAGIIPKPQSLKEHWTRLITSPEHFSNVLKITGFYKNICPNLRKS